MLRALTIILAAGLLPAVAGDPASPGRPSPESEAGIELFATGADFGVIEPCGCTGGQLGGIGRRATLLWSIASHERANLTLSTGGLPGGPGALRRIRYEIILLCMAEMGYGATGVGPEELDLGLDAVRAARELVDFPFVLTNVVFDEEGGADGEPLPFVPFHAMEAGGIKVRILAVWPESLRDRVPEGGRWVPPEEAMAEAEDQSPEAEFTVVLLRGNRQEAKAVAAAAPEPNVVIYSYFHSEYQVYEFGEREGEIRYLSPGDRGRFILQLGLARGDRGEVEPIDPVFEPVKLEYTEADSIQAYLGWYKDRVIGENVLSQMVEVEPAPPGAPYLGNETCGLCHPETDAVWHESKHSHAYETLVQVGRDYDPECLSCHTVGFGYRTGFRCVTETPQLLDVGCECCHGPCSDHVANAGRVKTPAAVSCESCHTIDHSPDFLKDQFWPKIQCRPDGEPVLLKEEIERESAHR